MKSVTTVSDTSPGGSTTTVECNTAAHYHNRHSQHRVVTPNADAITDNLTSKDMRASCSERAKRAPPPPRTRRRVERTAKPTQQIFAEAQTTRNGTQPPLPSAPLKTPDTQLAEISRRLRNVQHELHRNALEWEEAATALEQAEQE